jgi:uncharacterized protein YbjT (DUF2867 family)
MKILVTTPNGKVGRELVKILAERGVSYRVGQHTSQASAPDVVSLDYANPDTFGPALRDITALYLASPGDSHPEPEMRLVDVARAAGVERVVKLSVMDADKADSPLRRVERHIEASGLRWTHVRPTWFMQNFSTSHAAAIRGGTLAEPAGEARTAFVDARDIAAVAFEALTKPGHEGQAYTLTGPALLSRADVAAAFTKELGRTVTYVAVSDEQFRAAVNGHMPQSYVELLSALYAKVRAGKTERQTDDVHRVLGRDPIPLEQFIRDYRSVWA